MAKSAHGAPKRWLDEVAIPYDGDMCLLFPFALGSHGYGVVVVDGKLDLAHRYVCEAINGCPPFHKAISCHRKSDGSPCDAQSCCAPRHLRWDDMIGNMADRLAHGTHSRGERNPAVKLTEDDVLAIRATNGVLFRDLAAQYGVGRPTIAKIKRRALWGWLPHQGAIS